MARKKNPCEGCDYYSGFNSFSVTCNLYLITGKRRRQKEDGTCADRKETGHKEKIVYFHDETWYENTE